MAEEPGFSFWMRRDIFISKAYKLSLGLTQTSRHWMIGAVSLEVEL
jgi:hypothetical protein